MYADDTNITSAASDLNVRGREMKSELKKNKHLAPGEQVSLNVAKTEFILICTRQRLRLQGSKQCKYKSKVNQVEKAKSLDVLIDDNLTWKNRIDEISLALAP